jgi:translation initiation factor 1
MATGSSLGDLLAKAGVTVSSARTPAEADTRDAGPPPPARAQSDARGVDLAACGKLVLRKERKGRGGKTATVLSGLRPELRDPVARALRHALGCGASVDGDVVVLQGDLATRAQAWLAARGARRIVLGT